MRTFDSVGVNWPLIRCRFYHQVLRKPCSDLPGTPGKQSGFVILFITCSRSLTSIVFYLDDLGAYQAAALSVRDNLIVRLSPLYLRGEIYPGLDS